MFRKELSEKLEKIFGIKKVSFKEPGESHEHDTLFVEISQCRARARQGKVSAKVTGSLIVFAQDEELPYGFFSKRISTAKPELTRDLLFFDVDTNALNSPARMQNISERRAQFVYLYSAQYNPARGQLTAVDFGGASPGDGGQEGLDIGDGNLLDVGDGTILKP